MSAQRPAWVAELLRFWFEETPPSRWFAKDDDFDRAVRARFLAAHEAAAALDLAACLADADTALAAAIALDQLPRNMFRDTPRAFATDARARAVAEGAIAAGFDAQLPAERRQFLYLPLEHAEDAGAQARSVALFAALGPEYVRWAEAHKAIIDRFGRFPHRNAILGRPSTPEELAFLEEPGSSF